MSTYYLSRGDDAMIFHRQHVTDHGRKPVADSWRPVVVIDPDAASDADLAPLLSIGTVENARDVLRAMLNPTPPKPEEPGKYGVVVAGDGREWTRYTTSEQRGRDWVRPDAGGGTIYARWDDLDVIRVVREGVTA